MAESTIRIGLASWSIYGRQGTVFLGVHVVFAIAELVPPVAEVALLRDAGEAACELPARVSPGGSEIVDQVLDAVLAQLFGLGHAD